MLKFKLFRAYYLSDQSFQVLAVFFQLNASLFLLLAYTSFSKSHPLIIIYFVFISFAFQQ